MINLNFSIRNPFSQKFSNLWYRVFKTPFEYKFIELELYKNSSLLSFMFDLTARQTHSGLRLELGILGLCFAFNFYDSRHWNFAFGRYEIVDNDTN